MAPKALVDVIQSYTHYDNWVRGGRENEEKGQLLLEDFKAIAAHFFFSAGMIDRQSVVAAKGSSDLEFTAHHNSISVEVLKDAEADIYENISIGNSLF